MAEMMAFIREAGFDRAFLTTFQGLDAARHLYESEGFALISETLSQDARIRYRPNVGNPASPTFAYLPTGTITVASGMNRIEGGTR